MDNHQILSTARRRARSLALGTAPKSTPPIGLMRHDSCVIHAMVCFFSRSQWGRTSKSARLPWVSVAASSQTLPMVDGGRGGLQDPNTTWIGHHLVFRTGGLAAGPDQGRRPSGVTIARTHLGQASKAKGA